MKENKGKIKKGKVERVGFLQQKADKTNDVLFS